MLPQIALWCLAVQAIAVAALPLTLRALRHLPDRGYAFSKPVGLLVLSYLIWLPSMLQLLEYRRITALALLCVLGGGCWWRWGAQTVDWLKRSWRAVMFQELIFLSAGGIAAFVRAYNSDIIGQEKFMDLAFFGGFLATTGLPAEDSWLAGYGMPYYPYGYFMIGLPARLAGLSAPYGYNLALVLVFAMTFLLSASLVANLVGLLRGNDPPNLSAWIYGLWGGLLVAVCGNLVGPLEIAAARGAGSSGFWQAVGVKNLQAETTPSGWLPADSGWWWHASRVIGTIQPDGITEFPYFSFLLGDLHPHFTSLPWLLLVAALTLALVVAGRVSGAPELLLLSGMSLGVPIAANTWDAATAWSLYGLGALLVGGRQALKDGFNWRPLILALAPIPIGLALFSPYFVGYASQRLGLGLVSDKTPLLSLLIIFGPFFLLAALLPLARLARLGAPRLPLLAGSVMVAIAFASGGHSLAFTLALLILTAGAGWAQLRSWWIQASKPRSAVVFLLAATALALGILLTTELIFIRDSFGTRMNTVFKFYYHVWLLLGIVSAPALAVWMSVSAPRAQRLASRSTGVALLLLSLSLGLVYPVAATWSKSNGFSGPATLDGSAFLARWKPGEAEAIRWLAQRPGRPVVLEAVGGDYQEYARVSTFSGLPTVLGWVGHELQWRGQLDEYGHRQTDIDAFYERGEREEGLRILDRYRVRYVFVGSLEREKYGRQAEERLGRWLEPVFQRPDVVIFAAPAGAGAS